MLGRTPTAPCQPAAERVLLIPQQVTGQVLQGGSRMFELHVLTGAQTPGRHCVAQWKEQSPFPLQFPDVGAQSM